MSARDRARKARRDALRGVAGRVRLQRVLADAGLAARRACEALIESGRVAVNGRRVTRLPVFVDPDRDTISVDGRPLPPRPRLVYVMVHKPERVLGSTADEPGSDRRSVIDLVQHPQAPRLFPVGRLDYESRGLVLLTNDGELANRLTHPRYGVPKTYEVVVRGRFGAQEQSRVERELSRLARSKPRRRPRSRVRVLPSSDSSGAHPSLYEGTGRASIEVLRRQADRTLLRITFAEGRNRRLPEILRMAGCVPRRVTRVAIGPLDLRGLAVGGWRELTREEVSALRRAARGELTETAGPARPGVAAVDSPAGPRSSLPMVRGGSGDSRPATGEGGSVGPPVEPMKGRRGVRR